MPGPRSHLALALMLATTEALQAQWVVDDFGAFPSGTVAFVACDSPALGPTLPALNRPLASAVRDLALALLADPQAAALLEDLTSWAAAHNRPWRLALLEYAASWAGPDRVAERLELVVEVQATASDARPPFLDALPPPARPLDLGNGVVATVHPSLPRAVGWAVGGDRLVIGLGPTALARWFNRPAPLPAPWALHRRAVHTPSSVIAEAYLDLNALRHSMPDRFSDRPPGRLLEAVGLANARAVMAHLHRSTDSTALSLSLTWSSRSLPPDRVHATLLTPPDPPPALLPPDPPSWTLAVSAPFSRWMDRACRAYVALGSDDYERLARQSRRERWLRQHAGAVTRLLVGTTALVAWGDDSGIVHLRAGPAIEPADAREVFDALLPWVERRGEAWLLQAWPGAAVDWACNGPMLHARVRPP